MHFGNQLLTEYSLECSQQLANVAAQIRNPERPELTAAEAGNLLCPVLSKVKHGAGYFEKRQLYCVASEFENRADNLRYSGHTDLPTVDVLSSIALIRSLLDELVEMELPSAVASHDVRYDQAEDPAIPEAATSFHGESCRNEASMDSQ